MAVDNFPLRSGNRVAKYLDAYAAVWQKKIVGTVSGIQNFGGNLSGILAPALTGFIAHATNSFALALVLTGVVLLGGMLAYWFLVSDKVEVNEPAAA